MEEQKFSIFLVASPKDKKLVELLINGLSRKSIIVRFNELVIRQNDKFPSELIQKGLDKNDAILILITQESYKYHWLDQELKFISDYIRSKKLTKLIIPVVYGEVKIPENFKAGSYILWRENDKRIIDKIIRVVHKYDPSLIHSTILPNQPQQSKEKSTTLTETKQDTKEEPKNEVIIPPNYWLLKMNPLTWDIEKLFVGINTFFHTIYLGQKRPEYKLFAKIKKDDIVLCFGAGEYQSIVCEMTVTEPVRIDQELEEIFKMVVKRSINPPLPLKNFRNKISRIAQKLEQDKKPPELFFQIDKSIYDYILSSELETGVNFKHLYQPFYLTEGDHQSTSDQLEFENDINSFASVIALKKVNPPLAIGLFGNWGSGKSFFMEKLSERIDELAESKQDEYIQHVVQVKFNSWHYSDSNLWASLTTELFESLHNYAIKKDFGIDAINAIYKELSITSYQLEETQKKLDANKIQEDTLKEQKTNLEEAINKKMDTLSMWSAKDLIEIVFSDPYIQKDFQNIKAQFEEEKLIDNIDQIDEKLSEIDNVRGQFFESIILLKTNSKGKWKWIWILAIIFVLIGWLVLFPLKETIQHFIEGGYIVTGLILTWLINFIGKLTPYFNKISQFLKRLKSLKETIEKEKKNVRLKEHDEVDRLNCDINRLTAEKVTIEFKQKQIEDQKQMLEKEILDIGSGKLLINFLASKSTDEIYIKQLGIVSWIRKDFSKLNELFQKQKSIQAIESGLKTEVQIDRIVLYIDDLVRCNEDVVVKVLEAIHLLLAFPLFVVVVGVDPRWLNNALSEKYKNLFGPNLEKINSHIQHEKRETLQLEEVTSLFAGTATSYDYLEKIFQIPFALKPINKSGREKLIQYLTRDEMLLEEFSNIKEDSFSSSDKGIDFPNQIIDSKISAENVEENSQDLIDEKEKLAKEKLVFSDSELAYMQKISFLFGQTPRTINRYINIYRIIKAHGSLKIINDYSKKEFMPIMFMLGVVIGCSSFAEEFIAAILKANDGMNFGNFIEQINMDSKFKEKIEPLADDLNHLLVKDFKTNIELISRFSFRTLLKQN